MPPKIHLSSGGEGGITRRSAPRPFGAALRALSPLRRPRYRLIQTNENSPIIWRRGWDSNPRTRLGVTHFPGVRLRPLGHLSIILNLLPPPGGIVAAARVPEATQAIKFMGATNSEAPRPEAEAP